MSQPRALAPPSPNPLASIGRVTLDALEDLGAVARLALACLRSLLRPRSPGPALAPAVRGQLSWIFAAGFPLVGLAHVGIGSFLSMQAFFGATFTEGTGAVVGLGLVRNVAPLLTGFILAALLATRLIPELRDTPPEALDLDPSWVPDRDVDRGLAAPRHEPTEPARRALPRILAPVLAGPPLALWGSAVGMLVGWQVSSSILGLSGPIYFSRFAEMLWQRDVLGFLLKSLAYPAVGALFACREGLRPEPRNSSLQAAFRAVSWSMALILALNLSWFFAAYILGPPLGPTLLEPPST